MYVINDDRCDCYTWENGKLEARRTGKSAEFKTREEAEAAIKEYRARYPYATWPIWCDKL